MPSRHPKYLNREVTRHGREVWYVRRPGGQRVRLPCGPTEEGFRAAYEAAVTGAQSPERLPRLRTEPIQRRGYVYFLRVGDVVKIGFSTNPSSRLDQLKTGLPGKIKAFVFIQGDRKLEQLLHRRFASSRSAGEWFKSTTELRRVMAFCAAYGDAPPPSDEQVE